MNWRLMGIWRSLGPAAWNLQYQDQARRFWVQPHPAKVWSTSIAEQAKFWWRPFSGKKHDLSIACFIFDTKRCHSLKQVDNCKKSEDAWCILAFFWLRGQIVECSSDIRQFRSSRMSNCRKFLGIRQFRSNLVSNCRIYLTYSTALATTLSIITPASYLSLAFSYWHWVSVTVLF